MGNTKTEISFDRILNELSENILNDDKISSIYLNLEKYYKIHNRHDYSLISNLVFQQSAESNEILELNLSKLIVISESNKSNFVKWYKKITDHVRLSIVQAKFIQDNIRKIEKELIKANVNVESAIKIANVIESQNLDLQDKNTQLESKIYDTDQLIHATQESISSEIDKIENQSKRIEEMEQKSKKLTVDFVTILGIFSSIIFAAFGGLEILKNILGGIEKVPTGKLMVFSSLAISAIIMLLFILLNGISKLTSLNLSSCKCGDKQDCKCNFVQKHPTIFSLQLFLIFLFLLGITEYMFDYNEAFKNLKTWGAERVLITVGSIIILYFSVTSLLFYIFKSKNSNKFS
jgi:hypothetical protein